MHERPDTIQFEGGAGIIDCALDWPRPQTAASVDDINGWALLLHPHPLHGGARGNKVVTTLSRACTQAGMLAVRPDFRGVGLSQGTHDDGRGETDDMVGLIEQFAQRFPDIAARRFVLAGFSFGSFVAAGVAQRRAASQLPAPDGLVLVGTAVRRFDVAPVPPDTLVIHGEEDDTITLAQVLDWARPQGLPVVVIPGASHFFHGKLIQLKQVVENYLLAQFARNPGHS